MRYRFLANLLIGTSHLQVGKPRLGFTGSLFKLETVRISGGGCSVVGLNGIGGEEQHCCLGRYLFNIGP